MRNGRVLIWIQIFGDENLSYSNRNSSIIKNIRKYSLFVYNQFCAAINLHLFIYLLVMCYKVWNRIFAEYAPKYWKKSAKTWRCACWQIEPKRSRKCIASMAHWQSVLILSGGVCSIHRFNPRQKTLYLNLGSLYHKMKSRRLKLVGHLENKTPLNLNAPLNLLLGTRDHYHNSLQI